MGLINVFQFSAYMYLLSRKYQWIGLIDSSTLFYIQVGISRIFNGAYLKNKEAMEVILKAAIDKARGMLLL